MNTYVCDYEVILENYDYPKVGERLAIKGIEYQVLRRDWVGSYDYRTELAPVDRLNQYIN